MFVEILDDGTRKLTLDPIDGMPFYSDWLKILLDRGLAFQQRQRIIDRATGRPVEPAQFREVIVPIDRNQEQLGMIDDETGAFGIICAGCGQPMWAELHDATAARISEVKLVRGGRLKKIIGTNVTKRFSNQIRIGGFVQMRDEDADLAKKRIVVRWKFRFMQRMGLACESCRDRYDAIIRDTNSQNDLARLYAAFVSMAAEKADRDAIKIHADEIKKAMQEKCLHGMAKPFCAVCWKYRTNPYIIPRPTVAPPKELTPFLDVFDRDALDGAKELPSNV